MLLPLLLAFMLMVLVRMLPVSLCPQPPPMPLGLPLEDLTLMDQMELGKLLDQQVPNKPTSTYVHVYAGKSTETAFTSAPATRGSVTRQRKA